MLWFLATLTSFLCQSFIELNNLQNLTMGSLVIQNGSDEREILHATLNVCYTIIRTKIDTYSYTSLLVLVQIDFE